MEERVTDTRGILHPQAGAQRFALTRHPAGAEVATHVDRHWIVRWDLRGRSPYTQEVLPHPCVNLVFEGGRGRVFGVVRDKFSRRLEGAGSALGTRFRPGAFAGFVATPMTALVGRSVSVVEAFGPDGAALDEAVSAAGEDLAAAVGPVEAFLAARLPETDDGYPLVAAIVADMLHLPPGERVEDVARRHGVSARTLQRLFRRHIGLGPKWVLQRYRLHEAAERMAAGDDDLTRLALDLGYFDLAHFTGHFRRAVGRPPSAFLRGS